MSWFWPCSCCIVVSACLCVPACLPVCLHVYPQGSVCEDWTSVYCCYPLAVCQMIREMKRRMKTQTYHVSTALECSWRNSRQSMRPALLQCNRDWWGPTEITATVWIAHRINIKIFSPPWTMIQADPRAFREDWKGQTLINSKNIENKQSWEMWISL